MSNVTTLHLSTNILQVLWHNWKKKRKRKSGFKSLPLIIKGKIQWIEVTFKYTLLFFQIRGEQILRDKFFKKITLKFRLIWAITKIFLKTFFWGEIKKKKKKTLNLLPRHKQHCTLFILRNLLRAIIYINEWLDSWWKIDSD